MKSRIADFNCEYSILPVVREMSFEKFDIALFASKFDKFCSEGKLDLANMALKYTKDI
jgi:hypothetical protein